MQLIVSYLIMITIILTTVQSYQGLAIAQQLDGDVGNTSDSSNNNLSQVQAESLSNENQTQSFFNSDNQSVMLPEPIKDNIDQNIGKSMGNDGPAGEVGPAGPQGPAGPKDQQDPRTSRTPRTSR